MITWRNEHCDHCNDEAPAYELKLHNVTGEWWCESCRNADRHEHELAVAAQKYEPAVA